MLGRLEFPNGASGVIMFRTDPGRCCTLVILTTFLSSFLFADAPYQGVALDTSSPFTASQLDESLLDARQVGANVVAVDVNWSQVNLAAPPDISDISQRLLEVAPQIDAIRNRGLDVFLRSNVTVQTGEFPGRISPSSSSAWFQNYGRIMDSVAEFADTRGVSMLSVGSNLSGLQAESLSVEWSTLIDRVRQRFDGAITYAADARDDVELEGNFRDVPWWGDLDVIGINAYFPLTFDFNGIPEALNSGAQDWADDLESWRNGEQLEQPIVFTDVGYRSVDGGAVFPLERAGSRVDLEEQSLAYDAVLSAFSERDWWAGGFAAGWSADAQAGGAGDTGFTPQNKPAEEVLANYYGGRATYRLHPSLLESWESGLNGWTLPNSGSTTGLTIDDALGSTDGERSLSVLAGDGVNAAKLWTLDGSEAYTLLQTALAQPNNYRLRLDVSADPESVSSTSLRLSLQDDSDQPNVVTLPVQFGARGDQLTDTVEISLEEFSTLNPNSIYYELHLGSTDSSAGRLLLDNLRLSSNVPGDVTNDTIVDCDDIDAVSNAVRHGWTDAQFDINGDGTVDLVDRQAWMQLVQVPGADAVGVLEGDFDLNGVVEFADFLVLSGNFGHPGNWCEGDATGDREVSFADFLALSTNFGQSATDVATVPEPAMAFYIPILFLMGFRYSQRRTG